MSKDGNEIIDVADPQAVSFTPEEVPENPVEAAMQALEKDGAKFGDENDATPEPEAEAEKKEEPKAEDKKAEEKPKAERGEDGKFKKVAAPVEESLDGDAEEVDGADEQDGEQEKRSSGERNFDVPPARFLPRAKEEWANVPESVRQETYRAFENLERGLEESRQDREFRKNLREYEDMATQAGTTIDAALKNYVAIDQELRTNPTNGIARILQSIGLTPQQYAQHIIGQEQMRQQNPQMYAQNQQTQALQQQVQQLQAQIQQMTQMTQQQQEESRLAAVENNIIAPFAAEHPRYHELEQDIAFFLNSGKIPSNLPERQRLEVAYDMAERINPAPSYAHRERVSPAPNAQRPINPAGKKSVKGAPTGAAPLASANLHGKEAIELAMRQMGL